MTLGGRRAAPVVLVAHRASAEAHAVAARRAAKTQVARWAAVMAHGTVLEARPTAMTVPARWVAATTRTRRVALEAHHAVAILVVATAPDAKERDGGGDGGGENVGRWRIGLVAAA